MSIKPVDFQVVIPKAAEVSKIRNDEFSKNHAVHQQQMNSVQNKAESSLRQVYSQVSAQEAAIKERQERQSGNGKGKKREKDKEKDRMKANSIDIKI